jgi:propionate catabolism operon transcriptional regulator
VTACNPAAVRTLDLPSADIVSKPLTNFIPNSRVHNVIKSGFSELNQIQKVNDITIITNRIPILDDKGGSAQGCVLTFQDADSILKAEAKVRKKVGHTFQARLHLSDIIGQSEAIAHARERAHRYADCSASVFIAGETGTGKELFAQGIHLASSRARKPFVAVNCAAIPITLLESELFGYEEGAFTGARRGGKPGLFELAHNGTIFLDEIGEIPISIQARLLRVLEEREVLRVGGTQVVTVDVRFISASNADMQELMQQKLFRTDLFHRISVLRLNIPPLRERAEDILPLAKHFAIVHQAEFDDEFLEKLVSIQELWMYSWPGNVRELRNMVESATVLYHKNQSPAELLRDIDLPLETRTSSPTTREKKKCDVARELGISRTTLWRRNKMR